jgi:type IV fimbrial biogenesis protein FimT
MVTMTLVAILLTAAVPSFKNYSWNLRMRTAMDSLQTDLNLARRNAINLNVQTVSCPAGDTSTCSVEPDWQHGWIVFTDLNGDRQRQAGEPLLKRSAEVEFMRISSSQSRTHVRFFPNGSAPGSNMTIRFCDDRGARYAGKISISNSGRIQLKSGGIEATANCP